MVEKSLAKITFATLGGTFLFRMMENYHNNWSAEKVPYRKEEYSRTDQTIIGFKGPDAG